MVLIGVTDQGKIIGQELTDKIKQTLANEMRKIEPPTKIKDEYVVLEETGKFIITLKTRASEDGPFVYEGRPYIREQTATKRMPQQQYDSLVGKRIQTSSPWERIYAPRYSVKDLDEELILGVARKAVELKRMPEIALRQDLTKILESLDLIIDDNLTNAAIVLFGKNIKSNYPQSHIQLARFKGTDRSEFLDIDEAYGNVFELLEKSMLFVRRHIPIAAKIIPGQMERIETPLVPFDAIREALYNAFCHRDYSVYGGSISLAVYNDRMEIFNHGPLYGDLTIEKIKSGFSKRRNPLISDVFYRANLIEKWGRGIQKMITSCLEANDPEPEFFADSFEFKVIFRFPSSLAPSVAGVETNVSQDITSRQEEILSILEKEGELSTKNIQGHLNTPITDRTLRSDLNYLEQKKLVAGRGHTTRKVWFIIKK